MKKKIACILSVLSVVMLLGACGTDPTSVDYNGVTYEELYNESFTLGTAYAEATEKDVSSDLEYFHYIEENPSSNTYGIDPTFYIDLCEKWISVMEECGDFVKVADEGFAITKSGKTLTTDLTLVFEKRNVIFQLVYNYHDMELTGVSMNPVYSFGEKMAKAGMNTVISISIVFFVLIVISLIISGFNIFPYLEAKKREKAAKNEEVKDQVVTQIEQREEQQLTDDFELVAVIAVAIAASEGCQTSDFVVRSIVRR